ncbi:MAG: hypothetical protein NTU80_11030 [Verrucomicrobia bacterium]|nr:hypothetical protein [Verrucomicrobiota bacterium]
MCGGGQNFVAEHLAAYRVHTGRRQNIPPRTLPALTEWGGDFATLRGLRARD